MKIFLLNEVEVPSDGKKKSQLRNRQLLLSLLFISLFSGGIFAQDIKDIEKDMSFPRNLPVPRFIIPLPDTIPGVSIQYEDLASITAEKLEKLRNIRTVELQFNNQAELEEEIKLLVNFPSIKYLILSEPFFRSTTPAEKIRLPEVLATYRNIVSIKFKGGLPWDYGQGVSVLKRLPNLTHLFFEGFNQPIPEVFKKLDHLKGISLVTSKYIEFPEWISEMKSLESISLKMYNLNFGNIQYADYFLALNKLQALPSLKSIYLSSLYKSTGDFGILKFDRLKKVVLDDFDFRSNPTLTDFLTNHVSLESITITGRSPQILNSNFSKLRKLRDLSILGRRDSLHVNFNMRNLGELKTLKISNVNLFWNSSSFPDNLARLELSSMKLAVIPNSLLRLSKLKILSLSYDSLTSLPAGISGLKALEYLDLQGNLLSEIPAELGKLSSLKVLNLSSNPVSELPESLTQISGLKVLELRHGNLTKLPSSFGKLQSLETIDVNDNFIERIPESITGIRTLKTLDLSNNGLVTIPEHIGNLASLEVLNLDYNNIRLLPGSIGSLQRIKKIGLSFNDLDSIPDQIGKLNTLEHLSLNNARAGQAKNNNLYRAIYRRDDPNPTRKETENKIRNFPLDLTNWRSIKMLNISNNKQIDNKQLMSALFTIPAKNFAVDISNCGLTTLPERGWESLNAASLNLRDNHIDKIPADIVNAPYLSSINLGNNNLETAPVNLNQFVANRYEKALWFIDLKLLSPGKLPATDSMVLALLNKSNNHYYRKEFKESVELANTAMSINDSLAMKKIFLTNLGEAYYRTGDYLKAIELLTLAIRRDTAGNVRIMNAVIPDFEFRAKSYLQLGDTANAIKDYKILAERYREKWGELGLLLKAKKNTEEAKLAFDKGIKSYQDQIRNLKANKRPAEMHQLSMMELMIVKEDFKGAIDVAGELEEEFKSPQHLALLRYLKTSAEIAEGSFDLTRKTEVLDLIRANKNKISNWSYDLFLVWLETTRMPAEKVELIREITDLITDDI